MFTFYFPNRQKPPPWPSTRTHNPEYRRFRPLTRRGRSLFTGRLTTTSFRGRSGGMLPSPRLGPYWCRPGWETPRSWAPSLRGRENFSMRGRERDITIHQTRCTICGFANLISLFLLLVFHSLSLSLSIAFTSNIHPCVTSPRLVTATRCDRLSKEKVCRQCSRENLYPVYRFLTLVPDFTCRINTFGSF